MKIVLKINGNKKQIFKIMTNTIEGKDFKIDNLNPEIATIYPLFEHKEYTGFDGNYLVVDFGNNRKPGDLTTVNFIFKSEKYKINSTGASCGCTNPTYRPTENKNEYHVTIEFKSNQITQNVSKMATLYLNNNQHMLKFNIVMNRL
jgi:hypothetical protein